MTVRIVRLGTPRRRGEGIRIGVVRWLPRGVRKECYAADDWFDIWYPDLGPSRKLLSRVKTRQMGWEAFVRSFLAEMKRPTPRHTLDLLAAMSEKTNFSIGCYCEDDTRCHRSVLRELLADRGVTIL